MITAGDIVYAEKVLSAIYGGTIGDVPRQLQNLRVDGDAFGNWVTDRWDVLRKRNRSAMRQTDPRIEGAVNTMLMHFFLVGVICGRKDAQEAQ